MNPLRRWQKAAALDQLLYGTTPAYALRRPGRAALLLAMLGLGLWAGVHLGRVRQFHEDTLACIDGQAIEATR